MTQQIKQPIKLRNIVLAALAGIVVFSMLLGLDLANRGLAWRVMWSLTGEEAPAGQLRGMSEWVMSQTRPQPITQPLTPIDNANVNPYGINTFLHLEVEAAKVEEQARMISEAGFTWIRQQFEWAEIEVDGRGQFTDSRNDVDGDGEIDTISGWDKFDRVVDVAERYGLRIQARLDNPPAWTHADPAIGAFAPPDDIQDFVNFAVAVAERYQGRITHYQIWNEPNIYPEWGEQPVNPEAYTDLLCRTYDALKAVDPEIVVISGAMAPTISLTGRDLNDFIFLQRMYQAGAGECFDVLSVQGYGLNSGPTDRRMRPTTVNIARNLYIRDLMIANGDEHKAIWISEAAWNYVPEPDVMPDIAERYKFGQVTLDQAAAYIPQLYQRAQEEWPWVGVVNYWFFTRPDDSWRSRPEYYFRMVEPDYSPDKPTFTPLPVYTSMQNYIADQTPTLYRGVHQVASHWAIDATDGETVTDEDAQFGTALAADTLTFNAHGTDVFIRWRGESLTVQIGDGDTQTFTSESDTWQTAHIQDVLLPETQTISLTGDFVADSITVTSRIYANVLPYATVAIVAVVMVLLAVFTTRREI